MYYVLFILLALLSGVAVYFGYTRAVLWAFLLGTGLIALLGVVALNEGLTLGSEKIITVDGEPIIQTPQTITSSNDVFVYAVGHGMLYGGVALSAIGLIIAMIPFIVAAKQYSQ